MSEPRETARQIAEQAIEGIITDLVTLGAFKAESNAADNFRQVLSNRLASLTADLAQARQEIETVTRQRQQAGQDYYTMRDRAVAAEQARDEALKGAHVALECPFCIARYSTRWEFRMHMATCQSAARTALLEAAEALRELDSIMCPTEDIAEWLTTRAGGPRT